MPAVSKEVRLAQAKECVASGMTIKDWAKEHGVSATTMYQWVRRLKEEEARGGSPQFVELIEKEGNKAPERAASSVITVHIGRITAEISPGTSEYDILAFLEAASAL